MYLENIQGPEDIKKLNITELEALAGEIREGLMNRLSQIGGHFGPNFGIVEATIALHYVFDSPKDKFVFDVSHQIYTHKMLTGRWRSYVENEHFFEVSGYSNPFESEHDIFNIGHTSTSVSLATGLAKGRDLTDGNGNVIAIIGDGSLSGGEALEGLDYAGEMNTNLIILVNDNEQSIAENHGGLYKNLRLLRETKGEAPNNLFKAMGLDYIYLEEGNDIQQLIETFAKVKNIDHPIVVHIHTKKGKGYELAEKNKENWHWCMPFDPQTGETKVEFSGEDYGTLTYDLLIRKMKEDKRVVHIAAAVPVVGGFSIERREALGELKDQYIDVGIAEEEAVALASGIAKRGGKPVFITNATFIQRTYDQLNQDLSLNRSPATIVIGSPSVYGMNDVTHTGIYAPSMISNIPGLIYLSPTSKEEYLSMLEWSIDQTKYPVVINMPSVGVMPAKYAVDKTYDNLNSFAICHKGSKVAVIGVGDAFNLADSCADNLAKELGADVTLINPRFISGIDTKLLEELKADHSVVVTMEPAIMDGGLGQKIAAFYGDSNMKVLCYGLDNKFYDRYNLEELLTKRRMTPELVTEDVKRVL